MLMMIRTKIILVKNLYKHFYINNMNIDGNINFIINIVI